MGAGVTFAAAWITAIACAAVAWRSRRWRRRGDHPHCRRCDYDLSGHAADAGRCPECGADLARPRATVVGERRPARFVQWAAATIAVVMIGVAAVAGYRVEWLALRARIAPTAWLLRDVAGPWGRLPAAANAELERRLYDDAAADVRTRVAIARAMRRESITARPIVRAGDALPVALKLDGTPPAGAAAATEPYAMQAMCVGASIVGGPPLAPYRYGAGNYALHTSGATTFQQLTVPRDAAVGPARIRVVYEYRLVRGDAADGLDLRTLAGDAQQAATYDFDRDAACVARWDEAYELPVTVLAADATDDVPFVAAASVGIDPAKVVPRPKEVRIEPNGGTARCARCSWNFVTSIPVGIAYDVALRDAAGVEVPIGPLTVQANQRVYASSYSGFGRAPAIDAWTAERADVVLRPSATAARSMMTVGPVLSDEIVFADVPIRLPVENAQPR